jgi:hypothetical protein
MEPRIVISADYCIEKNVPPRLFYSLFSAVGNNPISSGHARR